MDALRESLRGARRVVVKVGSNVLVGDELGAIDRPVFASLVKAIAVEVRERGRQVVLVSSGAVALGRRRIGEDARKRRRGLAHLQALAALGQSRLMHLYETEFAFYDLLVGQVLLTQGDVDDRRRFINARHTLTRLTEEFGAVPIVNENDTVANEELALGDNDRLAALVASLFEADLLVILSDVEGLYDKNPSEYPDAELLTEVRADDETLNALVWQSPMGPGRGGMATKIEAARMAARGGIPTVITAGRNPRALTDTLAGEAVGTLFRPPSEFMSSRRLWLLQAVTVNGVVRVDAGAAQALVRRKTSLLPTGIVEVDGSFSEGAAVEVVHDGRVIARGLAAYSSADLRRIAGHQSSEIESILGVKHINEAIHRDDLVLVEA